MTDLITRLESADGPSGSLLLEAAKAVWVWGRVPTGVNPDAWVKRWNRFHRMLDAEAWTSAAEMLVPEGWNWMAGNRNQPIARAYVENGQMAFVGLGGMKRNPDRQWFECVAATPALALAAAALKARGV